VVSIHSGQFFGDEDLLKTVVKKR